MVESLEPIEVGKESLSYKENYHWDAASLKLHNHFSVYFNIFQFFFCYTNLYFSISLHFTLFYSYLIYFSTNDLFSMIFAVFANYWKSLMQIIHLSYPASTFILKS